MSSWIRDVVAEQAQTAPLLNNTTSLCVKRPLSEDADDQGLRKKKRESLLKLSNSGESKCREMSPTQTEVPITSHCKVERSINDQVFTVCFLCDLHFLTDLELEEHLYSLLHHRALDTEKGKDFVHECNLCCTRCKGLSEYVSHLRDDGHKRKVETRKEDLDNNRLTQPVYGLARYKDTFYYPPNQQRRSNNLQVKQVSSDNKSVPPTPDVKKGQLFSPGEANHPVVFRNHHPGSRSRSFSQSFQRGPPIPRPGPMSSNMQRYSRPQRMRYDGPYILPNPPQHEYYTRPMFNSYVKEQRPQYANAHQFHEDETDYSSFFMGNYRPYTHHRSNSYGPSNPHLQPTATWRMNPPVNRTFQPPVSSTNKNKTKQSSKKKKKKSPKKGKKKKKSPSSSTTTTPSSDDLNTSNSLLLQDLSKDAARSKTSVSNKANQNTNRIFQPTSFRSNKAVSDWKKTQADKSISNGKNAFKTKVQVPSTTTSSTSNSSLDRKGSSSSSRCTTSTNQITSSNSYETKKLRDRFRSIMDEIQLAQRSSSSITSWTSSNPFSPLKDADKVSQRSSFTTTSCTSSNPFPPKDADKVSQRSSFTTTSCTSSNPFPPKDADKIRTSSSTNNIPRHSIGQETSRDTSVTSNSQSPSGIKGKLLELAKRKEKEQIFANNTKRSKPNEMKISNPPQTDQTKDDIGKDCSDDNKKKCQLKPNLAKARCRLSDKAHTSAASGDSDGDKQIRLANKLLLLGTRNKVNHSKPTISKPLPTKPTISKPLPTKLTISGSGGTSDTMKSQQVENKRPQCPTRFGIEVASRDTDSALPLDECDMHVLVQAIEQAEGADEDEYARPSSSVTSGKQQSCPTVNSSSTSEPSSTLPDKTSAAGIKSSSTSQPPSTLPDKSSAAGIKSSSTSQPPSTLPDKSSAAGIKSSSTSQPPSTLPDKTSASGFKVFSSSISRPPPSLPDKTSAAGIRSSTSQPPSTLPNKASATGFKVFSSSISQPPSSLPDKTSAAGIKSSFSSRPSSAKVSSSHNSSTVNPSSCSTPAGDDEGVEKRSFPRFEMSSRLLEMSEREELLHHQDEEAKRKSLKLREEITHVTSLIEQLLNRKKELEENQKRVDVETGNIKRRLERIRQERIAMLRECAGSTVQQGGESPSTHGRPESCTHSTPTPRSNVSFPDSQSTIAEQSEDSFSTGVKNENTSNCTPSSNPVEPFPVADGSVYYEPSAGNDPRDSSVDKILLKYLKDASVERDMTSLGQQTNARMDGVRPHSHPEQEVSSTTPHHFEEPGNLRISQTNKNVSNPSSPHVGVARKMKGIPSDPHLARLTMEQPSAKDITSSWVTAHEGSYDVKSTNESPVSITLSKEQKDIASLRAATLSFHDNAVLSVYNTKCGKLLACSKDKKLTVIDVANGQLKEKYDLPGIPYKTYFTDALSPSSGSGSVLLYVVFAGEGGERGAVSESSLHRVHIDLQRDDSPETDTKLHMKKLLNHVNSIMSIHPDHDLLYLGARDGHVIIYSTSSDKVVETIDCHSPHAICCLTTGRDGARKVLCCGSSDCRVSVRDASDGLLLKTLLGHTKTVNCLQLHRHLVYSGASDRSVLVHNIHTGDIVHRFLGMHGGSIKDLYFHDDLVVTLCMDKSLRVLKTSPCRVSGAVKAISSAPTSIYVGFNRLEGSWEGGLVLFAVAYVGCVDGKIQVVPLPHVAYQLPSQDGDSMMETSVKQERIEPVTSIVFDHVVNLQCLWNNCGAEGFSNASSLLTHITLFHATDSYKEKLNCCCLWGKCTHYFSSDLDTSLDVHLHMDKHVSEAVQSYRRK